MGQSLIRWRLGEAMVRYGIKGKDLATELGISSNAVSNLKRSKTMPQLTGQKLNNLCNALNKLSQDKDELITPALLIEYAPDIEAEAI